MKKKETILISIIIILIISLIGTIIYFNKSENQTIYGEVLIADSNYLLVGTSDGTDYLIKNKNQNYQEGDKLELVLTNIKKDETPYEAKAKKIIIIKNNQNNNNQDIDNSKNEQTNKNEENNTEQNKESVNENNDFNPNQNTTTNESNIISYFENYKNEIETYSTNNESLGKTIKQKFIDCIDFIFYNKEINGKTFESLSNEAKIKIISIMLKIDAKIDEYFPEYKNSINKTYQNIKSKLIEKYLEITTSICQNDENLCKTAKEGFSDLKENFGITWEFIKNLTKNGIGKLKDWYEIWRYN